MSKSEKGVSVKTIARERIRILFDRAAEEQDPVLAARYVHLAREMAMKQRLILNTRDRRSFCRACGAYLVPGKNLQVRIQRGRVIYTCQNCGSINRIPLKKSTPINHTNR